MLTANAAKLVEREYRRHHPRKGMTWWVTLILVPLWLCVGVFAALCLEELFFGGVQGDYEIALAAGVALGFIFFCSIPLRPLYVIGHELTHWIAAKITFHKTGEIKLKWNHGYIEIIEPNGFIALAPYWVPFYFTLSACIVAFAVAVRNEVFTPHVQQGVYFWFGLMYAHHIALTTRALRYGQKDLEYCGKLLSWCIIISMNLLTAFLAFAFATPTPLKALVIPWRIVKAIIRSLFQFLN